MQQSSITDLLIALGLAHTDVIGRSGHESGTTIDTHEDKMSIAAGNCGGDEHLAHWSPDADVKAPKLDQLPTNVVHDMMDELFAMSKPMQAFLQGVNCTWFGVRVWHL